jgi:hypothetical protein
MNFLFQRTRLIVPQLLSYPIYYFFLFFYFFLSGMREALKKKPPTQQPLAHRKKFKEIYGSKLIDNKKNEKKDENDNEDENYNEEDEIKDYIDIPPVDYSKVPIRYCLYSPYPNRSLFSADPRVDMKQPLKKLEEVRIEVFILLSMSLLP